MPQNFNICYYESKNLFLSFNGPFCPNSHRILLKSFAGARLFTAGLFLFPSTIRNALPAEGVKKRAEINAKGVAVSCTEMPTEVRTPWS